MKANEESTMDEKTLTSVLSENVTDIKEIKDYIKEQQKQTDQKNELIAEQDKQTRQMLSSFENKYKKIEVTVPAPSTLPITKIAGEGVTQTRAEVLQVLTESFNKNRIWVLPEDGGKGFWMIMAKRSMYLSALAIAAAFVCWFGFRYWYKDSRNSRFRTAWYWNYLVADSTKRQRLQNQLDSLNVPDIYSYRTDSIERFLGIRATDLRIKQLEMEADSLKALRRKP